MSLMGMNSVVIGMILKYCESIVSVDLNFELSAFIDLYHWLLLIKVWLFDLYQYLDSKFYLLDLKRKK